MSKPFKNNGCIRMIYDVITVLYIIMITVLHNTIYCLLLLLFLNVMDLWVINTMVQRSMVQLSTFKASWSAACTTLAWQQQIWRSAVTRNRDLSMVHPKILHVSMGMLQPTQLNHFWFPIFKEATPDASRSALWHEATEVLSRAAGAAAAKVVIMTGGPRGWPLSGPTAVSTAVRFVRPTSWTFVGSL